MTYFKVVLKEFMVLTPQLPHRCLKQVDGVTATFGKCPRGSSFFLR